MDNLEPLSTSGTQDTGRNFVMDNSKKITDMSQVTEKRSHKVVRSTLRQGRESNCIQW